MRFINYLTMGILLVVLLSVCSCGQEDSSDSSSRGDLNYEIEKSEHTAETLPMELEGQINAVQFVDIIYDVEKCQDDKYAIYGASTEQTDFCGLLYSNGTVEVFDYYTRIYPVREDRFLATKDEKAGDMSYVTSDLAFASVTGVIIDENGEEVFSDDRNFHFIPIGYNRIMVFLATSGYDGENLQYGIMDGDGNWICELSESYVISDLLIEFDMVKCNNDGTWQFNKNAYVIDEYGDDYDVEALIKKDNRFVQLQLICDSDIEISISFFYDIDTNKVYEGVVSDEYYGVLNSLFERSFSNGMLIFASGSATNWENGSSFRTDYYDVIDLSNFECIEEIAVPSLATSKISGDYYADDREKQIKNIVDGTTIKMQEKYFENIKSFYVIDDYIYAIFKGQDKNYYFIKFNSEVMDGDNLKLLSFYDGDDILFWDQVMVYLSDDGKVYIANTDNCEVVKTIEPSTMLNDNEEYELHKLSENSFVLKSTYEGESRCVIYNIDGEKFIK